MLEEKRKLLYNTMQCVNSTMTVSWLVPALIRFLQLVLSLSLLFIVNVSLRNDNDDDNNVDNGDGNNSDNGDYGNSDKNINYNDNCNSDNDNNYYCYYHHNNNKSKSDNASCLNRDLMLVKLCIFTYQKHTQSTHKLELKFTVQMEFLRKEAEGSSCHRKVRMLRWNLHTVSYICSSTEGGNDS